MAYRLAKTLTPLILPTTIFILIYTMIPTNHLPTPTLLTTKTSTKPTTHNIYTAPTLFFTQSLPTTNSSLFEPLSSSLGLIPQPYDTDSDLPPGTPQWTRFLYKLHTLNTNSSSSSISYRLLILTRHGEGWHNVAERFFGTERWDCVYAGLEGTRSRGDEGDGGEGVRWADADLTVKGWEQAQGLRRGLERLMLKEGVVVPERFYVSPLRRALRTAEGVWRGLVEKENETEKREGEREFRLTVKEGLREGIGIHTCDRRSSKGEIQRVFPSVEIEERFAEDDLLWRADLREPGEEQTRRLRGVLDDVLSRDGSLVISMTSHGGTIQSILRAVGHRAFEVGTGGILPVVVRVEAVQGEREKEGEVEWEGKPECVGGEPGKDEVEEMLRRFEESVNGGGMRL
jgi:broad specificity phosphatase PhoE